MTKKTKKTPWVVFAAIALGMIIGPLTGTTAGVFGISFYSMYDLFGTLFIKALTLIVVPLVASSIISGIARMGSDKTFGRLGLKTFGFYVSTTFLAVLTGLLFVNMIKPGTDGLSEAMAKQALEYSTSNAHLAAGKVNTVVDIFHQIIPSNIVDAFGKSNMLGIIFFSILFGYALSKIDAHATTLLSFWQGVFQAMIYVTHLVMKVLPFGVFCLVAKVFATTGLESLKSLTLFFVTVVLALGFFMFVVLPLVLKFIGRVSPLSHFRAMAPALVTAFSTSSSSASLPVTLDCAEKRAGISNKICSLVLPLGISLNLAGSALYECVAAMFVAQVYGIEISIATQFIVVSLALITSMGVAGIPAGSLVAVIVILKALGLPAEAIGLFIAVDRLLDMCRTTVNVFSDSCCAALVARSEGEKILTKKKFS
ncbi:MAG: dicarboxylate/amino acid:cation symporter [Chlamydiales bacterium]|nr:dicarboxylate/amino acid:cation symporter [Chlamydiales bacterium]